MVIIHFHIILNCASVSYLFEKYHFDAHMTEDERVFYTVTFYI